MILFKRPFGNISLIAIVCLFGIFSFTQNAQACTGCGCVQSQTRTTIDTVIDQHIGTRDFITDEFQFHQNWLLMDFWDNHVSRALMLMTEQLVATGMGQMFILGAFFDADIQLERQRLVQTKAAEAYKDYQPSFGMCTIGTTARGLSAAERNGTFTSFVMAQRSIERQLGMYSSTGAAGPEVERQNRIDQVKDRYCDTMDNYGKLSALCTTSAGAESVNKDIDFTRTIDSVRTLDINFKDPNMTGDEQDVIALAANLFAHDIVQKQTATEGGTDFGENPYIQLRSIIAKRSVAENSFNTIVGLKTAGGPATENMLDFSRNVMQQLGVTDSNEQELLLAGTQSDGRTAANRPSYYAQMEVLAQRIYQNPDFFTNLYDKPANVMRKDVAMQAIELMLERDMYKSELRSEMVMAVLLEMELKKYQRDVQNQLNRLDTREKQD